jgi:hypothetical protein
VLSPIRSRRVCLAGSLRFVLAAWLLGGVFLLLPAVGQATTIEVSPSPFTGDPIGVSVLFDDESDPGNLVLTLSVDEEGNTGDLRGFFAQVSDESLLSGLSVSGADVTSSTIAFDAVIRVGGGNNLKGGGTPCLCDLGIEFGSPGIGHDDIQSTTFTISHVTASLDVSLFSGQKFGVRVTSVGSADSGRGGSSKLIGVVPEPTTALLTMLGLAGLSLRRS